MDKLPMRVGDANMWYRNCTIQGIVNGEVRPVVVAMFTENLEIVGTHQKKWSEPHEAVLRDEVRLKPSQYELTMPRAGYFIDADGDLIYIELRAFKTIRRAMLSERIHTLKTYKENNRLRRSHAHFLAMEAMMTGRTDKRVITDVLAIDDGAIHYRGREVGTLKGKTVTLKGKYKYLKEYIDHAITR